MRYICFITLLILASATLGSAQLEVNLSESCKDQLETIVGSDKVNSCLPLSALLPIVSSTTPDPAIMATAADKICALPKCSDDLISKTQSGFKTACKTDLDSNNQIASFINNAFLLYPPTRDSVCFKNSTGGYCFIESYVAADQVVKSAPKGQSPLLTFIGAPKETVCTPCNKAISNTFTEFQKKNPEAFTAIPKFDPQDLEQIKSGLTTKCGDKFLG